MKTSADETLPLWPHESTREIARAPYPEPPIQVVHLFRSEAHNYFGHYQRPAGSSPAIAEPRLEFVAGQGIVGDRFFGYKKEYSGQVTFFAEETWLRLREELGDAGPGPEVFRRNIITRGIDLLSLVRTEFVVQGVIFLGVEHCKPCAWMDQAFAPGTLTRLAAWKAGGLRAKVLSHGWLEVPKRKDEVCLGR